MDLDPCVWSEGKHLLEALTKLNTLQMSSHFQDQIFKWEQYRLLEKFAVFASYFKLIIATIFIGEEDVIISFKSNFYFQRNSIQISLEQPFRIENHSGIFFIFKISNDNRNSLAIWLSLISREKKIRDISNLLAIAIGIKRRKMLGRTTRPVEVRK